MDNIFTKAKFWKCALQVNPYSYIKYRGADHEMTEEQYNNELLRIAKENDIKVIGLADHGNVNGVDSIRTLMNSNGIVVFPGFEISSSEKAHFVCLFPEDTTTEALQRYLGSLDLLDPDDGIHPSRLSAEMLLKKVDEDLKGFVFAAHCTDDNGVLFLKLNHVWSTQLLKAAQIPGTLEDLRDENGNRYRQILLNKTPEYKRESPVAVINAKDIAIPEDLANPKASCLIKMTNPCFESFKLAFQDPESRVRLNSDVLEKYYSRIESLKITGGYLDGMLIDFSEHLNAIIGGRGTGKSTLIECIRYTLDRKPIGENAQKQHDGIIKENLGKSKARVELKIRSSKMNGKCFTVARRYGENISIKDEAGNLSSFSSYDLLPEIEIYGQNEIYEIAQNPASQRKLLTRFLESKQNDSDIKIKEALSKLAENRKKLNDAYSNLATIQDEVSNLPKLEEQVSQFKNLGLEEKLKIIPLLETEKRLSRRSVEEEESIERTFLAVKDTLPDTVFLSDHAIANLPHAETLRKIKNILDTLRSDAEILLNQWHAKYITAKNSIESLIKTLHTEIHEAEANMEKTFKDLPACEGKSGKEIGIEFHNLMKDIERIRPKQSLMKNKQNVVAELQRVRKLILDDLSVIRANRSAEFERSLKKLNKRLAGKLKLTVKPEADRSEVISFLLNCDLDNVGEARLSWIKDAEDFSPVKLAKLIKDGTVALRNTNWGLTPTVADALFRLKEAQILQLEEIVLPDIINIELNTAHEGQENFRSLSKLSTGQQCTAILHLLLLDNLDPLIIDQPEDNLDNAFIAERIVVELRSAKIARQFIFATHNANIPVFGDAEWIGVLESREDQAYMPPSMQGAIDVENVKKMAADILEGGKSAFNQRKVKYGF